MPLAALPPTRVARWSLLERLLERWFPSPRGASGVDERELRAAEARLGRALPAALREWYLGFGARGDVWALQDELVGPDRLDVDDDVLVFAVENQGVVQWGLRVDEGDDPPVMVSEEEGWVVESPTTSAFALHFALLNVKWSKAVAYRANGQAPDEALAAIAERLPRLPFQELHWPAWPTRFFGTDDVLVETNGDSWIWVSARTAEALREVDRIVRDAGMAEWETYEEAEG
jgi:hypothetical protein